MHSAHIRRILDHIGVESQPPRIAPALGPLIGDDCDEQAGENIQIEPDWGLAAQPAPDYEVDQRINAASAGGVFILLRAENRLESRRDGRVMLQKLVRYRL